MRTLVAAAALILVACTAAPPDVYVPDQGAGDCNAAPVQDLIGRTASAGLGADALRRSGARALRWIGPDTAVTMDYRTDRLNIELDARNRVTALRCG